MEQKKYWYSIISYVPKSLLNERLNVGLIVHNPQSKEVKLLILDEKNRKLISILTSRVAFEEYKIRKMLIEHKLNEAKSSNSSLLDYDLGNEQLIDLLAKDFSPYFRFSKKQMVITNNLEEIFNKLADIYICKNFLDKKVATTTVKQVVRSVFEDKKLLGTKIKPDVSIKPIKEIVSLNYKVDFIYKNTDFHLVQAVPRNNDSLNDWFSKMVLFQNEFNQEHKIEILFDEDFIENISAANQILNYLSRDSSTKIIDLKSNQFKAYCNNIQKNGLPISEYENELLIV